MDTSVAIVHDYLTQKGGAERVVLSLSRAFPGAPVFTSFYDSDTTFEEFRDLDVRPLWLDRMAPLRGHHRAALPLLPIAFATSRVEADIVVCTTSGWAHGIRTNGRKIVYCHSPAKWLYRRGDYLGDHPSRAASVGLRMLDPLLRRFDVRAAATADRYVANSSFIASQIREVYGIAADVLHPPCSIQSNGPRTEIPDIRPGFVLTVARLLPYKNVEQTVESFRRLPERTLVVVGDGPERDRLRAGAPPNVRFVHDVSDATLRWLYASCSGLVAASREDFGLTPVEAAAYGKPVAALRWGGFLDTVLEDVTGLFFDRADPIRIADAIERLTRREWDASIISAHAETFSEEHFVDGIRALIS